MQFLVQDIFHGLMSSMQSNFPADEQSSTYGSACMATIQIQAP